MTNKTSFTLYTSKATAQRSTLATSKGHTMRWRALIAAIILGCLALLLFLSLGGMFATVGPWLIFAGALVTTRCSTWGQRA